MSSSRCLKKGNFRYGLIIEMDGVFKSNIKSRDKVKQWLGKLGVALT